MTHTQFIFNHLHAITILAFCQPIIVACLIFIIGKKSPNLREIVGCLGAISTFIFNILVAIAVIEDAVPTIEIASFNSSIPFHFVVEPLGVIFSCMISLLWFLNILFGTSYFRNHDSQNQTAMFGFMAIAISAGIGMAFAGNLLTIFVFYEILSISTFPLATHSQSEKAYKSGRSYVAHLVGASAGLLLPAILITIYYTGSTGEFTAGGIFPADSSPLLMSILFIMFIYGSAKHALMPMHRWLPSAMGAPTPISVLEACIAVVNAGILVVAKISLYIFGLDILRDLAGAHIVVIIASITAVTASIIAIRQHHLKRMLAYSTISQLSFMIIGIVVGSPIAIFGAILHMLGHAFGKITLFFTVGSIISNADRSYLAEINGIGRKMPFTFSLFTIASLSMIGLPLTFGIIGKWYMISGAWSTSTFSSSVGICAIGASTILTAVYLLPIIYRGFFLPADSKITARLPKVKEASILMLTPIFISAVIAIVLFFGYKYQIADLLNHALQTEI